MRAFLFFCLLCSHQALAQTQYQEFFGLNVFSEKPVYLSDLKELGVRWVRIEYRIKNKNIEHYRKIINQLKKENIKVMMLVDYMSVNQATPGWKGTKKQWEPYLNNFWDSVETLARELGKEIDAWEVWNEPDHELNGGYDPGVPAAIFGALLKEAAVRIRRGSSAPLIIGGLATDNFNYYTEALNSAGNLGDYSAIGVHTYGPSHWTMKHVERELDYRINAWHKVSGLPIWLTEAGAVADKNSENFAAKYIDKLHTYIWDNYNHIVEKIFYFSWHDAIGFSSERFGLLRLDNTRKPSFDKYKEVIAR